MLKVNFPLTGKLLKWFLNQTLGEILSLDIDPSGVASMSATFNFSGKFDGSRLGYENGSRESGKRGEHATVISLGVASADPN